MRNQRERLWVHPDFANMLKHEAVEQRKSLIELTRCVSKKKSYIDDLRDKWSKK